MQCVENSGFTDGGGWALVAKVNPTDGDTDPRAEPVGWFDMALEADLLASPTLQLDLAMGKGCSMGRIAPAGGGNSPTTLGGMELTDFRYAGGGAERRKRVTPRVRSRREDGPSACARSSRRIGFSRRSAPLSFVA